MQKKSLILCLMFFSLALSGCQMEQNQNIQEENPENQTEILEETENVSSQIDTEIVIANKDETAGSRKYKLVAPDSFTPVYLELNEDQSFTMDFNYCEGIAQGGGSFSVEGPLYFLSVENSEDLASLEGSKIELKAISNDELQVVSEVYRTENGEKVYFCTPFSDPNNEFDNEEYNLYQMIEAGA